MAFLMTGHAAKAVLPFGILAACLGMGCADATIGDAEIRVREDQGRSETIQTWAFKSRDSSRYAPDGLLLYLEAPLDARTVGELEIDLRWNQSSEDAVVDYRERRGDQVVFDSDQVTGQLELPRDPEFEQCECADARLSLRFVDFGEDGEEGTDDDQIRELPAGRLSWGERVCAAGEDLEAGGSDALTIALVDPCNRVRPRGEPRLDPGDRDVLVDRQRNHDRRRTDHVHHNTAVVVHTGGGCSGGSGSSSSGCGGDSGSSSSGCGGDSGSSSSGCEGDSGSSSSGCEGDSGSSSSGCEGDSGSSSSGCEGDSAHLHRLQPCSPAQPQRLAVPAPAQALLLIAWAGLGRRLRRRLRGAGPSEK